MAYFSSGTEGADYEDNYCSRCVHFKPNDKFANEECRMFYLDPNAQDPNQMELF